MIDAAALFSAAVSVASKLGVFEVVIQHEPKSAPVSTPALALWLGPLAPLGPASGLSATSARVMLMGRIYLPFLGKPEDAIDPKLLNLTAALIGAYSAGFTLGGAVMEVDLLGAYGAALESRPGYIDHDSRMFRAQEITIPLIVPDLFTQEA